MLKQEIDNKQSDKFCSKFTDLSLQNMAINSSVNILYVLNNSRNLVSFVALLKPLGITVVNIAKQKLELRKN